MTLPSQPEAGGPLAGYRFQLLRLRPVPASDEHYNVAVILLDADGRVVDARFSPDLSRLRCHPAVEMAYVEALRNEFEDRLLLGEGFSEYFAELSGRLSNTLDISEPRALDAADPASELQRLVDTYVAPRGAAVGADGEREAPPGSRRDVRRRLEAALEAQRLFANGDGLRRSVRHAYGPGRLVHTFDFGYAPADGSGERLLHALGARDEANEAARLCFIFERLRSRLGGLTGGPRRAGRGDARLLESCAIEPVPVSSVAAVAERVRRVRPLRYHSHWADV